MIQKSEHQRLKAHIEDIKTDDKLIKADIIHLIETNIHENEENPLKLCGYEVSDCSVRKGMGISICYNKNKFKTESIHVTSEIQVAKCTSEYLNVITVYRSSRGCRVSLNSKLKEMVLNEKKAILITGDFNLCYMTNKNNQVSKELEHCGFKQLMNGPTHIQGGHIDHVYWRDASEMWMPPCLERYSA